MNIILIYEAHQQA